MNMRRQFVLLISAASFLLLQSCSAKKDSTPTEPTAKTPETAEKKPAAAEEVKSAEPAPEPEAPKPKLQLSENPEISELVGSLENPRKGAPVLRILMERSKKGDKAWVKEALSTLRRALRHPKPNARSQAGQILVLFADKRRKKLEKSTVSALADAIVDDRDGDVRALIAKAVATSKDSRFAGPLTKTLERDSSSAARAAAAKTLGVLRAKSATVALIRALDDREVKVRLNSINSLRKLKAKQAVSRLADLLEDDNEMVRSRAHKALKDLTGKRHAAQRHLWR